MNANVTTELSDCGCCEGVSAETPVALQNRPGLSAIAYRVGTHSTFRETLHARLSGSGQPALNGLTTRDTPSQQPQSLSSVVTFAFIFLPRITPMTRI